MLVAVATCVCLLKNVHLCYNCAARVLTALSPKHLVVYLILKPYNKCHFLIVFAIFFASVPLFHFSFERCGGPLVCRFSLVVYVAHSICAAARIT
jgi:hypothetical protein